jgi:hypothetical protein
MNESYRRLYRAFNYGMIGLVDLIFSVALSRSLGITGLLLPTLCIIVAYLIVTFALDLLIAALEYRSGDTRIRHK